MEGASPGTQNSLDNIPCLCARLKVGVRRGGKGCRGPAGALGEPTMFMKTQGVSAYSAFLMRFHLLEIKALNKRFEVGARRKKENKKNFNRTHDVIENKE